MEYLLLKLLNMSIEASLLIVAIMILRAVFQRMPKNILCLLWCLVGIRLICPFSLESVFSLLPDTQVLPGNVPEVRVPGNIQVYDAQAELASVAAADEKAAEGEEISWQQAAIGSAGFIWLAGTLLFLGYGSYSYVRLKRKLCTSIRLREGIWQSEHVSSPFLLGFFRPRIYIPFGMEEEVLAYVVSHEEAHISRLDYLTKPLGFVILAVHWFNPFVWAAYLLFGRDVEAACDERVIRRLDAGKKKAYSEALLMCSMDRKIRAACPLAFGEAGVKGRVRNISRYRKPGLWMMVLSLLFGAVFILCFMTSPKKEPSFAGASYQVTAMLYDTPKTSFTYSDAARTPEYCVTSDYGLMEKGGLFGEDWESLGGLSEVSYRFQTFADMFSGDTDAVYQGKGLKELYGQIRYLYQSEAAFDNKTIACLVMELKNGEILLAYGYGEGHNIAVRWLFSLEKLSQGGDLDEKKLISQIEIAVKKMTKEEKEDISVDIFHIEEPGQGILVLGFLAKEPGQEEILSEALFLWKEEGGYRLASCGYDKREEDRIEQWRYHSETGEGRTFHVEGITSNNRRLAAIRQIRPDGTEEVRQVTGNPSLTVFIDPVEGCKYFYEDAEGNSVGSEVF